MAGFFPLFFKKYWTGDSDPTTSTYYLGLGNSVAGVIIFILAPLLGAISDQGQAKKNFLFFFTLLGSIATSAMYWVGKGDWSSAIVLYILGTIGFSAGMVFYDALILDVADEEDLDRVSSQGYALGYLGGGLLFALNVAMTIWPHFFGLADAASAVKISFLSVGIWWVIFSLPLFLWVKEGASQTSTRVSQSALSFATIRSGFKQFFETFKKARALKGVSLFLVAYWFYIDGVNTIIKMAIDYGISLGFDANSLIVALLITQFIGFPAAIGFGAISKHIGAKKGILIGILVYCFVSAWGYQMDSEWEFYLLAIVIGLIQGGVQALSRSYFGKLIPKDQAAEFYGFYNMIGKFAAILGPLLMGVTSRLTHDPRLSILSVVILFAIGGTLLALSKD